MPDLCDFLIDKIARDCIDLYEKLPKSGKAIQNEWTVLACVVQYDKASETHQVVSLGTGSKCVGESKMSPTGNILNDSHAEVFARRGFLLYLYENIINATNNIQSIFIKGKEKFLLKNNIEFVFYSSQLPCGDASIIPKCTEQENFGDLLLNQADENNVDYKKRKFDIYRTGAKCLSHNEQDPKMAGEKYHLVAQVRTKPGRGDRTLSVSCSDKMARWIHLGIQGSLLHLLLSEPIFIKYFIFGSGAPYSLQTLHRALLQRNCDISVKDRLKEIPKFYRTSLIFSHIKTEENKRPAAGSIVWIKTKCGSTEVAVQGKKLGLTKKKQTIFSNSLCISKYNLYRKFLEILQSDNNLKYSICGEESLEKISYSEMKNKSVMYHSNWCNVKEVFFKSWILKPDIWDFCINIMK